MVIAVNARFLIKNKLLGLGHFSYEVLKRWVISHPGVQFIFVFDRPYDEAFIFGDNVTPVVAPLPARATLLFYWYFEHTIPAIVRKYKPDLFFSPDNFMSLSLDIPTLLVVHDLAYIHYPKVIKTAHLWYYRYFMPRFLRKASRIATVSEFTKQDIISQFSVPPGNIDVAGNGFNNGLEEKLPDESDFIQEHTGGKPFFIYVGMIQPRKNILRLLDAFDLFKKETGSEALLVIAGSVGWKKQPFLDKLKKIKSGRDVKVIGYRSTPEIGTLMRHAIALLLVSYFEGFGMPVIEAQANGCPVIASNGSSLPEVAGKAAVLIDPFDTGDIARAMIRVYSDPALKSTLIEAGKVNIARFDWDDTAASLWESAMKCLGK